MRTAILDVGNLFYQDSYDLLSKVIHPIQADLCVELQYAYLS